MKHFLILFFLFVIILSCKKPENPENKLSKFSLNCEAATPSASALIGEYFSGFITVPYLGGDGSDYNDSASLPSTSVTGLSITLQSGSLAKEKGNLIYNVSGTPTTSGSANFAISIAGQSCNISIPIRATEFIQYGTPFVNVTDKQDATIYQVNIRAFSSQGNLQGVIARLDSIKALGANVIYLMPTYPLGILKGINSPYCIRDYKSINPEFGNLTYFRALVNAAHNKNMSVIMDWVANHTSYDHEWITDHKDWYLQDAAGNVLPPPGTGWNDVAQLNFNKPAMRLEMINSMKYWVYNANVDGFRFDFADGPPVDFWKQTIDTLRNIKSHKLLLLAEGNRSNHFTVGFDFTFGFSFFSQIKNIYKNNLSVININSLNNSEYLNATSGQQVVRYLTNHDVNGSDGTPLELFGGLKGSMAVFVVVAYMKSVPMIYSGQEVGTAYRLTFPFTGANINWNVNPTVTAEYKKVIAFRNASEAIRRGTLLSYSTIDVCAFTKELGSEKVFVVSNLRNKSINFTLPSSVANTTWTNAMTGFSETTTTEITLEPFTYLVLKN